MVRVFYFTDVHFKKTEIVRAKQISSEIVRLARESKCDFIVCGGDTLDQHEVLNSIALSKAIKMFTRLKKIAPLYIILGNHDFPNNTETLHNVHPFLGLGKQKNIFIPTVPMKTEIKGVEFGFASYYPPGKLKEFCSEIMSSQIIFCHQEFQGAKYGMMNSIDGDSWLITDPFVISGHIHEQQVVQANIFYPGSTIQHGFSDSANKTAFLLEIEKDKFQSIPLELKLEKFLEFNIGIEDINNIVIPMEHKCKVIVHCPSAMLPTLPGTASIRELRKKCKVVLKGIFTDETQVENSMEKSKDNTKERKRFLDLLYIDCLGSEKEVEWMCRLFNN